MRPTLPRDRAPQPGRAPVLASLTLDSSLADERESLLLAWVVLLGRYADGETVELVLVEGGAARRLQLSLAGSPTVGELRRRLRAARAALPSHASAPPMVAAAA